MHVSILTLISTAEALSKMYMADDIAVRFNVLGNNQFSKKALFMLLSDPWTDHKIHYYDRFMARYTWFKIDNHKF